jgi:hypothetical protein
MIFCLVNLLCVISSIVGFELWKTDWVYPNFAVVESDFGYDVVPTTLVYGQINLTNGDAVISWTTDISGMPSEFFEVEVRTKLYQFADRMNHLGRVVSSTTS